MAPKKSKKDKKSGESSSSSRKKDKKPRLGPDGKEPKKKGDKAPSRKNKAWGKSNAKDKDGNDDHTRGGGLKPVRIKLDKEGRDAILDILHKLHVAGAEDGAEDETDGSEGSDEDSEEDDEHEEENDGSGDSEEGSGGGSDADVEIDDRQGHGDFDYDGSFGDMANLMSGLVVNDSAPAESAVSMEASNLSAGNSLPMPGATKERQQQQEQVKNPLLGGSGGTSSGSGSASKRAARSNVTREKLLASMVQEDRKTSKQVPREAGGVSSAAIHAASTVGGGPVSGAVARGYQRPDPPGAGKGNDKILVFDRKEPLQGFLNTCRGKLHIKKKAKGAALLESEEVVDWLSDLSWVPNDAVVLISCTSGAGGTKEKAPVATAAASSAPAEGIKAFSGSGSGKHDGGETSAAPLEADREGERRTEEDDEEAVALAALGRIRETYRARARERQSGAVGRARGGDVSDEEAGKRMMDKRREMMAQRRNLPAYLQREDIVKTIRDNQVVVLSGETGCGKTTQVPQFVLDDLIDQGEGGKCNIICTQPRRISAVGVADRVASERCERVGGTVGYQIRLDSRVGPSTRLTFCTTGILLRRLTSDDTLAGVSHVMVDEASGVHERDLQTDFLLVILRDLLPKRPDLRVVLMSATLQADLFTKYFHGCPAITVPGRTFPVEVTYMDEVNRLVRGTRTPAIMPRVSSGAVVDGGRGHGRGACGAQADPRGRGPGGRGHSTAAAAARGQGSEADDGETPAAYDPLTGEPLELGEDGGATSAAAAAAAAASAMVSPKCEDKVDYDIMVDLVDHIMKTEGDGGNRGSEGGRGDSQNSSSSRNSRGGGGGGGGGRGRDDRQRGVGGGSGSSGGWSRGGGGGGKQGARGNSGEAEPLGAILIFLPGFAEIDQLVKALQRHPRIGRGARVFPLHSSLPSNQQKSIFQRMPPGVRKIVVSTNIAETSVTIDDCTHVIDAGRVREMRYDPVTRMSCLVEVWISKASGSQRAGRAGRVRAGKCWRLYPEAFHRSYMPTHTLAEMLRTPLEELVLQVLLLELGSPAEFLDRAVEPPPPKMLRAALRNLDDLQAVIISNSTPILTPLGYHLAHLPMDACVGKLLLIAAILQCLDPILTIAAALSDKAPFQRPFGEQARADKARQGFAQGKSDHLAIVEAFGAWRNKRRTSSYNEVRRWCREKFLSQPTLERLDNLREQFRQQLAEVGFASSAVPSSRAAGRDAAAAAAGGRGNGSGSGRWRHGGGGEVPVGTAWEGGGDGGGRGSGPGLQDPDLNSGNTALVQSVLVAGLYPHVAAFVRPDRHSRTPRQIKKGHFVTRDDSEPVFMHPSSVNHERFASAAESGRQVWVVYHSKMKTNQVYLHDSTYATPFSLMLWGARVRHERPLGHKKKEVVEVVIDRWLRFRMTESTAVAFKAMRRELSNLLVRKIEAPFTPTGELSNMLVSCLGRLMDIEARNPFN
ncbi:unnamed protein product [Ectocarpus sp. CCAP 1310/34]|nr:unnamed protein product [Ectocarpus sp. CCAP 1310/34]